LAAAGGEGGGDVPEAELWVELTRAEATALLDLGHGDEAARRAREALSRADALGLHRERAQLLNGLGMLAYSRGDFAEAGRLIRRGIAAAGELGAEGEGLAIHLRQNLGNVLWKVGDEAAARQAYGENLRHAEATHDLWGQLTASNNLGILEASRGDWRAARDDLARVLAMARRLGAREQEAMARLNLAEVEEMQGDWARARRHLDGGLALLAEADDHPLRDALLAQSASLARKRGDGAAAAELAGRALAGAAASGDRDLAAQCELLLGLAAKDREEWESAAGHLDRAAELAAGSGTRQLLARVRTSQADLALRRRDEAGAAASLAEARRLIEGSSDPLAAAKLRVMEARLASLRGDDDAAGPLYAAAVRELEAVAAPYELGRSLYEWGLRTWNPDQAAERLRRALGLFERLGAEAEARRARGALERIEEHGRRGGDRDPVLYEVVKVVNSTLDLSEVLDRTMDLVLEHLRAQRGMIVLHNPLTRELETAVSRNLGRGAARSWDAAAVGADEAGELSESVVRRVIEQREPVVTIDAQLDQRFRGAESIVASHILSILCVPMSIRDRLEGAIYVDHTSTRGLFEDDDVRFLVAFADQAAVAIEKARLYGEQEAARRRLKVENEALKREILSSHHLGTLIGKSRAIRELKNTLERVAQSDSTVLIRGESGTGKGLVARILHNVSARREGPFVQFNCAALPETLVESELFGHEKGAFTGAAGQKPGRFELADGGTIFLDEVGKISRSVQAKLLRVVEDKQFERVGGTKTLTVDVRIVAATNLDLEEAIAANEFREDLYYRLNIIPIVLPPLRERREDVPYLVEHFLAGIGRDLGQPRRELDADVLDLFAQHPWPGNVRELESAIHRALVLSSGERLTRADFAWIALQSGDPGAAAEAAVAGAAVPELAGGGYEEALNRYDRRLIETALESCGGRIRETARLLGIARNTLKAKMERYGLDR
jgi:Nif-specific regulatory protein